MALMASPAGTSRTVRSPQKLEQSASRSLPGVTTSPPGLTRTVSPRSGQARVSRSWRGTIPRIGGAETPLGAAGWVRRSGKGLKRDVMMCDRQRVVGRMACFGEQHSRLDASRRGGSLLREPRWWGRARQYVTTLQRSASLIGRTARMYATRRGATGAHVVRAAVGAAWGGGWRGRSGRRSAGEGGAGHELDLVEQHQRQHDQADRRGRRTARWPSECRSPASSSSRRTRSSPRPPC